MSSPVDFDLTCPIPLQQYPHVLMAHGGGGRMMKQLIDQMFLATFGSQRDWQHDAARLELAHGKIAFTTDSYVVSPLFFPGGDIGSLAVYGTVNDLAMAGAKPLYLSLSFILEEGLALATLWQVVQSIKAASDRAQIQIVTGDTKVVERGKGDGLYINTAGIGLVDHPWMITPQSIQPGDVILLSGDIGRHEIAIMAQRESLEFETTLTSDLAPVSSQVQALIEGRIEIHCLRDLTRGGLATALNEIALSRQLTLQLEEQIPTSAAVQGACEILGLDPLYLANEGRFIAFVPAAQGDAALHLLQEEARSMGIEPEAAKIGWVEQGGVETPLRLGQVNQYTGIGGNRLIDYRNGGQLPRIC